VWVRIGIEQEGKIPKLPANITEVVKLFIDFDNCEF
jgi:hypothetical protein